jgi:type I restriction enzyme S subunit
MSKSLDLSNFSIDKTGWKKVKFGDVVFEPKESVKDPIVEGIEHVVGLEHIDSEDIHLRRSASIEEETTFTKKFAKGDILFGRRRAYLKKAARADFEGICSGDITVMRATDRLLPDLLPFIVNNDKFFDYAITHSAGGLSPRVKFKDLANYEFLLPPKQQQVELSELLKSSDNVLLADLNMRESLNESYASCLVNQVVKASGDQFSRVKLEDLITIKHGFPFKSEFWAEDDQSLPIAVTIGNYNYTGGFRFVSTKIKCYSGEYPKEYELFPGDILLAMTCQTPGGEILGIPGIIEEDGRTYLHNQRIGKVEVAVEGKILSSYLYILFLTGDFRQFVFSSASGTKVLHTSPSKILKYEFLLPPMDYQRKVINKFEILFRTKNILDGKLLDNRLVASSLINQVF